MDPRGLLIDTIAHIPAPRALEQLSAPDAERRLPNAGHSIAEVVAHMAFWQDWFCRRCDGNPDPMPAPAAKGWPEVVPGSWPDIHDRFIAGLDRVVALGDRGDQPIAPAIEFPPLAGYAVREAVIHVAQHNSHHLGEVIVLRQVMGLWPPPSGSWTW